MIDALIECLICGGAELVPFLDLGDIPLANSFLKSLEELASERKYPLRVCYCARCSHVQLSHSVNPAEMFSEYIYFTGNSESVVSHARRLSQIVRANVELDHSSFIVEIGSNDGTVLQVFKEISNNVLGVDPARNVAQVARERGVPTVAEFFTEELADDLSCTHGKAAVIVGRNVLAHVPKLRGLARGIAKLLARDGLALIEVPYFVALLEHMEFDTIYHEHLSYFSVAALDALFKAAGLELIDVKRILLHGGSLLLYFQQRGGRRKRHDSVETFLRSEAESRVLTPGSLETFAERVMMLKDEIREFVHAAKSGSRRMAGYGACAKGNVLMNMCGLSRDDIEFIVDRSTYKHGLFAPGKGIPIFSIDKLYEEDIDFLLLLAWNFADEIIRQQSRFEAKGGVFIVPIPHPQFIRSKDLGRPDLKHLASSGVSGAK